MDVGILTHAPPLRLPAWDEGGRPLSMVRGRKRRNDVERSGMTKLSEIKVITGNSTSCWGFSIALSAGSIPAASPFAQAGGGSPRNHTPQEILDILRQK